MLRVFVKLVRRIRGRFRLLRLKRRCNFNSNVRRQVLKFFVIIPVEILFVTLNSLIDMLVFGCCAIFLKSRLLKIFCI